MNFSKDSTTRLAFFQGLGAETGFDHLILADMVDDLLGLFM
jgi:hypothetical protein